MYRWIDSYSDTYIIDRQTMEQIIFRQIFKQIDKKKSIDIQEERLGNQIETDNKAKSETEINTEAKEK